MRVLEYLRAGQLFRYERAAHFKPARFENVVGKRTGDKKPVVFFQKQFDERCLRLEFCAAEDGERGRSRLARGVDLANLVAHEEPPVPEKKFRYTDHRRASAMRARESIINI